MQNKKIGILAVHGSVAEHAATLEQLKLTPVEIRSPADFAKLDGLILPGGESTTIGDLVEIYGLKQEIIKFATTPKNPPSRLRRLSPLGKRGVRGDFPPILGTCAGLILLAQLGLLATRVERNAYGRQLDSFEASLKIPTLGKKEFPGVFIRTPKITKAGTNVEVLAKFENSPVLVRQNNIYGATFHPELTDDTRLHKLIFT